MKDILGQIEFFIKNKKNFAIATVIQTWGSGPRPVGSSMVISENLDMAGSVSGGCVEGTILQVVPDILKTNRPKRFGFGVTDEEAWAVGLSCGGQIQVFVEPFLSSEKDEMWNILRGCLTNNRGAVLMTKLNDEASEHILVVPDSIEKATTRQDLQTEALRAYMERKSQIVVMEGGVEWFAEVFSPKMKLIIVGAAHITVDLIHLAQYFGFETVVIDPRGIFAEKTQFSTLPDQLLVDWPANVLPDMNLDAYTFAVLLTHDPKIDDQALDILLRSKVAYIGALGSRKTHDKRVKRLKATGFGDEEISRIHAPIGLDIGAKSAREIALSIVAELIRVQNFHKI